MFAVVQIGSSQYKVAEGDQIHVNKLDKDSGKAISLEKVLMFVKGTDVRIGQPYLKDVKVSAKVSGQLLGKKLIAFKFRRRKSSSSKKGHRQKLTALDITKISTT